MRVPLWVWFGHQIQRSLDPPGYTIQKGFVKSSPPNDDNDGTQTADLIIRLSKVNVDRNEYLNAFKIGKFPLEKAQRRSSINIGPRWSLSEKAFEILETTKIFKEHFIYDKKDFLSGMSPAPTNTHLTEYGKDEFASKKQTNTKKRHASLTHSSPEP
ncbi:unnamed protein product [Didymodactylos carnosus]|uniref:Uncharacterized protein n=1 Tax=Didymodactylos carnosus TaxID=1234261 RepID=A0A814XY28_9BILA|nr:unnamed protein product [Didymodactylos carnosus]CAF1222010.1 unnamed protein product [Didymodactylos carnosus]CAF3868497.1 unnamed protein product [Didymodactylos carnosus]CAF3985305.1 unnamed protein product [Didymodactylos carnosus]